MSQWPFGSETIRCSLPIWHGKSFDCYQQELSVPRIGVNMSSEQYTRDLIFRPLVLMLIHSWDVDADLERVWL